MKKGDAPTMSLRDYFAAQIAAGSTAAVETKPCALAGDAQSASPNPRVIRL